MKYFIKDTEQTGHELDFKPQDDDGPDHKLWVSSYDEEKDLYVGLMVKVSQLYEFFDWLKNWAPDPREQAGQARKEVREVICSDCGEEKQDNEGQWVIAADLGATTLEEGKVWVCEECIGRERERPKPPRFFGDVLAAFDE